MTYQEFMRLLAFKPWPVSATSDKANLSSLVVQAMTAGLEGQRLPDFGNGLTPEGLEAINTVYDVARNRGAGGRVYAHRVR